MASVIIGTTPTIKYDFKIINVGDIVSACFTIKQSGVVKIEKDLNAAIPGENSLSWRLTQQETLSLKLGTAEYMLNYKLRDGTRGASKLASFKLLENHKNEVI